MAKNKLITIAVAIVIAVASFTVIGSWASKTDTYEASIKALDTTKTNALDITAVATTSAGLLAAIPGDATTPLANKLMDVAGYTVIVFTAIVLEKYLLTLTGVLAFKILIPLACLLIIIACFATSEDKRNAGYRFAARIVILGLLLWALVPVSIKVSNNIQESYKNSAEVSIEIEDVEKKAETEDKAEKTEAATENDKGLLDKAKSMLKKAKADVSEITENSKEKINQKIEEFKEILDNLIERLAVMIVTTCVIPVGVLLLGLWIVKIILGVSISTPKMPKASNILKKTENESGKE